jgi:2-methylcitrate dehydratase
MLCGCPREVFDCNKGFIHAIAGLFGIDWQQEGLKSVRRTILKRYNAEIHSHSAIEALLALPAQYRVTGTEVERIELDTFQVAYDIIGSREEVDKHQVRPKEKADHSMPYLLAVARVDGEVLSEQKLAERILADDVQELLRRVEISPDRDLTRRFPAEHSARVRLPLCDGRTLEREQPNYECFHTRPMSCETVTAMVDRLVGRHVDAALGTQIIEAIARLDDLAVSELMRLPMEPRPSVEGSKR